MTAITELARRAEAILSAIIPGAVCVAQEWDERIDCIATTPAGTVVGEMIRAADFGDDRIRETAARLAARLRDEAAPLVDELVSPMLIRPS